MKVRTPTASTHQPPSNKQTAAESRRRLPMESLTETHVERARIYAKAGTFDRAVECYERALSLTPNNPQLYCELGEIEERRQDLAAARSAYERAIALQPHGAIAFDRLASVYARQGRPRDAIRCYREALDRFSPTDPNRLYAYNNLGYLLVRLERFDEALVAYRAAGAIDPQFAPLYNNLGKWWLLQGEFDRAIAAYNRALTCDRNRALTHYNLGKAYGQFDRHAEAITCFERASALKPGWVAPQSDCGFSWMERGNLPKAFACFGRAIAHQPEWVEAYCDRMAQVKPDTDFDRARLAAGQLVAALSQNPDSPELTHSLKEIYTYLARVQFQSQRYGPAADYYQKAATLAPQDRELRQQLQECERQQQRWQTDRRGDLPQGVYSRTRDWWEKSHLDSSDCVRVRPGTSPTVSPDPLTPSFVAEDKCQGSSCGRCLKSIFDRWEMVDLGGGVLQCSGDAYGVESRETFVATIPQGRAWVMPQTSWWQMCETMAIVTPDNYLLADVSPEYPGELPGCDRRDVRQHRIFRMPELPPLEKIEGTVAVVTALSANVYFHWMVDLLPRLDILQRGGFDFDRIDKFLVNQYQQPFQKESLQRLGIPEEKIIESDRHPHIQADRLLVPSLPNHFSWLSRRSVAFLRQTFLPKTPQFTASPERIYISRSKTRYRHLLNEVKVLELLEEYGFVSVRLETLSLDEQIHLFSQAKAIVAPHGSGLTNLIFCQPQTQVIELVSPNYIRHYFGAISQLLDLEHYYVRGEAFTCSPIRQLMYPNALTEDIQINLDILRKILERIGIVKPIQLFPLEAFVVNPMQATLSAQQTAEKLASQAETLLGERQFEAAIAACEKALATVSDFAPACKMLGNIYRAQKQIERAREWYLKAIEFDPKYGEAYGNLGNLAAQEKSWPEAIRWYQKAISLDPSFAGAYDRLGKVWQQLGREAESLDCTYRAYELEPTAFKPEEHVKLGDRLGDGGQLTQAITCYRQALKLNPQLGVAYDRLSRLLAQQGGSVPAATEVLGTGRVPDCGAREGASEEGGQTAAHCQQTAETLLSKGKLDEATVACEEALNIDPNFAPALKTLGNIARARGELDRARESYLKAIEVAPNYAEAYANLGNLAAQAQQWPEAIERYQKAIALKPDFAGAYDRLSKVWQKLGKEREATECAFRACELDPQSASVERWLGLGNALFRNGQLDRASVCYRQALGLNPNLFAACQNLAEALTQQGKSDEAAGYYRRAMQLYMSQPPETTSGKDKGEFEPVARSQEPQPSDEHPDRVRSYLQQASDYYQQKQWQAAIDCCTRAIEIAPEDPEAHALLGNALYARRDLEAARSTYIRALELQPDLAYVLVNLGSICAELDRVEDAISYYQQATDVRPDFPLAYCNWGKLYLKLDRISEAIDCYGKAIELDDGFARAHFGLAAGLCEQERWEEAASAYQKIFEIEPDFPGLYEKWADVRRRQIERYAQESLELYGKAIERHPDNIELYRKALEIAPDRTDLYKQLVALSIERGELDEAIVFCQIALQMQPRNPQIHWQLGQILATRGQWEDAIATYERAIAIDPQMSWGHFALGTVFASQADAERALAAFKRAADCDEAFYARLNDDGQTNLEASHRSALEESNSFIYSWIAEQFTQQNQLDEAIFFYQRELEVHPENAEAYFQLANTFSKQDQWKLAVDAYDRACQLNYRSHWLYHYYGVALEKIGRKAEAIDAYQMAIELDPNFFWSYWHLGVNLEESNDIEAALQIYKQASRIDSNYFWLQKKLGDLLTGQGNIQDAAIAYKKALEIDPSLI
ncbi:MAG: tetratricopeptide repeat protein [Cyanobacteriota bacterium]|nr:tetratricopeptide repeat protein [Cyanobacteriota bacterium]